MEYESGEESVIPSAVYNRHCGCMPHVTCHMLNRFGLICWHLLIAMIIILRQNVGGSPRQAMKQSVNDALEVPLDAGRTLLHDLCAMELTLVPALFPHSE